MTNKYHGDDVVSGALEAFHATSEGGRSSDGDRINGMINSAIRGELTSKEAYALVSSDMFHMRRVYQTQASWSVYTKEYIESLKGVLLDLTGNANPRVLEVCAGRGLLGGIIPNWTCTDKSPVGGGVSKVKALRAVKTIDADVLFASWIPYKSTLDSKLLDEWVIRRRKPFILVGEGRGGCTGSMAFWDDLNKHGCDVNRIDDFDEMYEDVPSFDGLHDYTVVIIPRKL